MKKLILIPIMALVCCVGCKTPKLESGGVYAPTNSVGQVVYNDIGLALSDTAYQLAYETVFAVLKFERDNRKVIWDISPSVKKALDDVRPTVVDIDRRWALARQQYKANPTPAGLSVIQTLLAEMQRLIPIVQQQIAPVYSTLTK